MKIILAGILLIYSSITDIKKREISGNAMLIFSVLGIICCALSGSTGLLDIILGIGVGIFMIVISIVTKGELGLGDGILLCVTGLYFGFIGNLQLLLMSLLFSAVFSIVLYFKNRNLKAEYPFVPFLFLSYSIMATSGGF